jgi:hypothetical protein
MCMACEMEAMWFAAMEARARAVAAEGDAVLPRLEKGRAGEGIAGNAGGEHGVHGESADSNPNPPPEEGGGSTGPFACEETQAE